MGRCKFCKKTKLNLANKFTCSHCKKTMCLSCRFPDSHKCKNYVANKVKVEACIAKKIDKI